MAFFKLSTNIHIFSNFDDFTSAFQINHNDFVLTHRFLYDQYHAMHSSYCVFLEDFGTGEPTDTMIQTIIDHIKGRDFQRIIAIGGGSVLDVAKVLSIKNISSVVHAFERKMPLEKGTPLIAVPTTCGTGSEVTNITIAEITALGMKMGLATDAIVPDDAVLIPELLKTLPFPQYMYSAIDAMIHAMESYVSPKSTPMTEMYSEKAIETILKTFVTLKNKGIASRESNYEDMLLASTYAGIAFGLAGVGAVHALSYPLGGAYHVPHGEANYQFLTAVFQLYAQKNPTGKIQSLNVLLASHLNVAPESVYSALDQLLEHLMPRKNLSAYGMTTDEIEVFSNKVITGQQRLLANNYIALTKEEIYDIYRLRFQP